MITWLIITKNYNLASQIFHYVLNIIFLNHERVYCKVYFMQLITFFDLHQFITFFIDVSLCITLAMSYSI